VQQAHFKNDVRIRVINTRADPELTMISIAAILFHGSSPWNMAGTRPSKALRRHRISAVAAVLLACQSDCSTCRFTAAVIPVRAT